MQNRLKHQKLIAELLLQSWQNKTTNAAVFILTSGFRITLSTPPTDCSKDAPDTSTLKRGVGDIGEGLNTDQGAVNMEIGEPVHACHSWLQSWRMVVNIYYITAAGNAISSQLGSSCPGISYSTARQAETDRPSRTKSHPAGSLSSSQPGGPPCWASPLVYIAASWGLTG